jgi:hypothetical protein
VESSHRGLRRRVAALALEVDVSKSETQGQLSGCEGAILSHLVFSLPGLAGQRKYFMGANISWARIFHGREYFDVSGYFVCKLLL